MNFLIVCHDGQEQKILPELKKSIEGHPISVVMRDEQKDSDYKKKDIVIVIGGDGTFLRASHFNTDVPVIGINPNPDTREGFYSQMDLKDFKERIKKVLSGDYKIINFLRLVVKINSNPLKQLVLNEAYIGDAKPYNVFNYDIKVKGISEFHRSSGIIIGTPSGSSAWLKSAGGKIISMEKRRFEFVARELYTGKHTKEYKIKQGMLDEDEELEITCKSPGIVVVDSISPEYNVKIGDKILIKASKDDLRYIKLN